MIRVLHYIGLLQFGGSQAFVMEVYRKIDRTKVQFDFVTFPDEKSGFYEEIIELGGMVYESPQYNGKNHFQFVKWWDDFFREHTEYKVFHSHVRSVASICIHIAHKHGCYAIAHSHSISNGNSISALIKNIMQIPIRFQADYMFACSEVAGKWLFGKSVEKKSNYKILSNAIDVSRFVFDEEKRNEIRNSLNIQNKLVIGTVGRLIEVKNHKLLLEVFAKLKEQINDSILLIVGDGELREEIENCIRTLGIKDSVYMLGARSNTQDYYQAMDVFVFPSLWEGLGIVAIEAQTSGLPCVVSNMIPKEIDLKENLVKVVDLDASICEWTNAILSVKNLKRRGRGNATIACGYDSNENTKWLENFYLKAEKELKNRRM